MKITDVWDFENKRVKPEAYKHYRYVTPFEWIIPSRFGEVIVPRGFISDGDSAVKDISIRGSTAHDRLYLIPEVRKHRLTHKECDLVYRREYAEEGWGFVGWYRQLALTIWNTFPWGPWAHYRRQEAKMGTAAWKSHVAATHVLPLPEYWKLNDYFLKNAVWLGPDGNGGMPVVTESPAVVVWSR